MQVLPLSPRARFSPRVFWVTLGLITAMLVLTFLGGPLAPAGSTLETAPGIASAFSQLPLAFIPKQGQVEPATRFQVYGAGNRLTFAPQEITLDLPSGSQPLRLRFVDANRAPALVAGDLLPTKINDYRGNDVRNWQTNVSAYAGISYLELYPGINLHYEGQDGSLKSTFRVAPGAQPAHIRWQYAGATAVAVDKASGDLVVTLPNQAQGVERAPLAWQNVNGRRLAVQVAYVLASDNSIGFTLGSYNPALPLTIDPTIVYETTLNLGDFDSGLDITLDAAGNAYVLGRVYDTNNDVLIAKLSASGTLLYVTYLRGSSVDFGGGLALDASGDVYVAGATDSADFPILNAMQPVKSGVTRDAFITKLAGGNGALLFSTFFGGSRSDEIHDIALNDAGEIYLVGYTESTDLPTVNPIQGGLNLNQCFCEDTFVTKLSPDAMTVLYSTYLGGSFEDYGESIALDGSDNIYITGRTQSDDFPTLAPIQPNRAGTYQDEDLFVSKISASGSLVYSTYLGGTDNDFIRRIAVDSAGNAFLAGSTQSVDFPTTAGAYQETYIGGAGDCGTPGFGGPVNCSDMFLAKINPGGGSLAYSTYLGGGLDDKAVGIALNDAGEAYLVGYTSSTDFPGVTRTGPGTDIAVAKMSAGGDNLLYTVIIDSAVANAGHGIALDNAGDIYITAAQNAPSDLYVAKISEGGAPAPTPTNTPVSPTPTNTPVPPTPTPAPSVTLHVGDLDGSSAWVLRRWYWQATVTIAVHDANHNPLSGATVSGAWSKGYSGSAQCTTDSNGKCVVSTGSLWRTTGRATFTVNDVARSSFTYAPTDNHDPDGDSNGTRIIVSKP
jgi:hypothetical protein